MKNKITGKSYVRLERFEPVYYVELYRKGRKIATIRSVGEFMDFSSWKYAVRYQNKANSAGAGRLFIEDNFGYVYRMANDGGYANIAENYAIYKQLKAQLEREHQEVVMTTANGEKHYTYTFTIKRRATV